MISTSPNEGCSKKVVELIAFMAGVDAKICQTWSLLNAIAPKTAMPYDMVIFCIVKREGRMDTTGTYFPNGAWRTSTPEEQGVDSRMLAEMLEAIRRTQTPVHSFLLVRHGYLIAEAYAHPQRYNTRNDLFSVTKSVISTLVGIAIGEGRIRGVDQRVLDFFPELEVKENGLGTQDMTVEHLLTLSSGHTADSEENVSRSKNFAQDFFALPFSNRPGAKFLYDSGASHMLSVILTRVTGMSAEAYAADRLFRPLGITDYAWDTSPEGLSIGGWGLRLRSADMAKFGYLVLHRGIWNGEQLVPPGWIELATRRHIATDPEGKEPGYGYQWWINWFQGFRADGYAGQCIVLLPELDAVAVLTCGMNGSETNSTMRLLEEFVLPAAHPSALPANSEACTRLGGVADELASPKPCTVPELPQEARQITVRPFSLEGIDLRFSLEFPTEGGCLLHIGQQGRQYDFPVGLDGVYQVSDAARTDTLLWHLPYQAVALRGRWESGDTFILDWQFVGEPIREEFRFTFKGDSVEVAFSDYISYYPGPLKPGTVYKAIMQDR